MTKLLFFLLLFWKTHTRSDAYAPRYPHEPGTVFSFRGDAVQPKQCLLALRYMFTRDYNERQGLKIYWPGRRFTRRQRRSILFGGVLPDIDK